MKDDKLLKYENMKLKHQLIFTLPASKEICGRVCPGCYAIKAQVRFPTALAFRERLLQRSKSYLFVEEIIAEINKAKSKKEVKAVRIHESGDFYSQEYLDKWVKIAKQLPDVKFYAFTKRKKDFDFTEAERTNNFVIIDSLKFNGLNYDTEHNIKLLKIKNPKAYICPATVKGAANNTCGVSCEYCWSKSAQDNGILFIKH